MRRAANADFQCKRCHAYVLANPLISGVKNRNHCPYCLWSRHLDLDNPGDRLSACKALMRPVGLIFKQTAKKYQVFTAELMVSHRCEDCGKISLNRIAADDDVYLLMSLVGQENILTSQPENMGFVQDSIKGEVDFLKKEDIGRVYSCLFGNSSGKMWTSPRLYQV